MSWGPAQGCLEGRLVRAHLLSNWRMKDTITVFMFWARPPARSPVTTWPTRCSTPAANSFKPDSMSCIPHRSRVEGLGCKRCHGVSLSQLLAAAEQWGLSADGHVGNCQGQPAPQVAGGRGWLCSSPAVDAVPRDLLRASYSTGMGIADACCRLNITQGTRRRMLPSILSATE